MTGKRIDLAGILRQRFFSALHLGVLKPGARLPSIRELEIELDVDRRTVLKAYRELEREGIVELKERSGIYFGKKAAGLPGIEPPADWAVDLFVSGLAMGIPAPRFPEQLANYFSGRRLRALCVECNSDQLESLSAEMESDYGFDSSRADVDELLTETHPRDDLENADLVVTTQFHAGEVQEIAARAGRKWLSVSLRTDVYAEIARLLPSSPIYFIVKDERYATKLGKIFRALPGGESFRPIVIGETATDSIPESAPVYISRAARTELRNEALLARVMPEERTFSLASAREILTLVVRAYSAENSNRA